MEKLTPITYPYLFFSTPSPSSQNLVYARMELAEGYLWAINELTQLSATVATRLHKSSNVPPETRRMLLEIEERLSEFRSLEPLNLKRIKIARGFQILTSYIRSFIFSNLRRPIRETPIVTTAIQYVQCIPEPF